MTKMVKINEARAALDAATFNIVKSDPWVPITLGGVEYKLEFSYGAVVQLYQKYGIEASNPASILGLLKDPERVAEMLECGMTTHNPMSLAAVKALMTMRHMEYYRFAIQKAMEGTQPDPAALEEFVNSLTSTDTEDAADPLAGTGISLSSGPSVEN